MKAFIEPPRSIPFYLRIGIWISRKITGRDLLPGKLLAWYPKAAISSGIMEILVAHKYKTLNKRILKLIRLLAFRIAVRLIRKSCHDEHVILNRHHIQLLTMGHVPISTITGIVNLPLPMFY